jgi:hypothetical protein
MDGRVVVLKAQASSMSLYHHWHLEFPCLIVLTPLLHLFNCSSKLSFSTNVFLHTHGILKPWKTALSFIIWWELQRNIERCCRFVNFYGYSKMTPPRYWIGTLCVAVAEHLWIGTLCVCVAVAEHLLLDWYTMLQLLSIWIGTLCCSC